MSKFPEKVEQDIESLWGYLLEKGLDDSERTAEKTFESIVNYLNDLAQDLENFIAADNSSSNALIFTYGTIYRITPEVASEALIKENKKLEREISELKEELKQTRQTLCQSNMQRTVQFYNSYQTDASANPLTNKPYSATEAAKAQLSLKPNYWEKDLPATLEQAQKNALEQALFSSKKKEESK